MSISRYNYTPCNSTWTCLVRFGLVLCRVAVLKISNWAVKYATTIMQFLNVFKVSCYLITRFMYNDFAYSYHGKLQVPRNVSLSSRYCNLGMYSVPTKEKKWENWLVKKEKGERKDNEVLSIWAKTSKNVASSWRQMTLESYTHLELQVGKIIWDHPFKMSACLREGGVSPCADRQKVTVHKDKKAHS